MIVAMNIAMNIDKKCQNPSIINAFTAFLLLICPLSQTLAVEANALLTASNEQLVELQNYQTQLEDLQSEFGSYHQSLLEPLAAMVSLLNEQGNYEQLADIQNRQLQVMRTVLGFEHPDLVPQLQSMISNQIHLGEWEAISDNLEHIRHLQGSNNSDNPEALLGAIEDQAFWYLSRAYLDDKDTRVRNFFLARGLYEEMEDLAEDTFGEDSPQMIPWLYKQAHNKFQLVQFLNADKGVGSDSVDRLVHEDGVSRLQRYGRNIIDVDAVFGQGANIPVLDGDSPIGEFYLQEGSNLLTRIENIIEAGDDPEAAAMAKIYRADFQMLQQKGIGMRSYRQAQELLSAAGVAADRIKLFFDRPMVIPVDKFFRRLDEAIAYQQQSLDQPDPIPPEFVHLGVFTAWSEALASTAVPVDPDPLWKLDLSYNQVDLRFSVSSRGAVSSVDVIDPIREDRRVERNASRALREIHLRPAVIKGRGKRIKEVHIRYRLLEE